MLVKNDLKQLYEIDEFQWLEETIKLLKDNRLDDIDLENLIEELEYMGNEKKHQAASFLEQIIRHLLLVEYWESEYEYNGNHWKTEILNFRGQLNERLTTNLSNYLRENLDRLYQKSLKYVKQKTNDSVNFPANAKCPYSLDQLLDEDWLP
jgi:hypothetical protein